MAASWPVSRRRVGVTVAKHQWRVTLGAVTISSRPDQAHYTRDKRSPLTPYPSTTVNRTLRHRFIRKCPLNKRNLTALSPSCRVCLKTALFNQRKLTSSPYVSDILLPPAKASDPNRLPSTSSTSTTSRVRFSPLFISGRNGSISRNRTGGAWYDKTDVEWSIRCDTDPWPRSGVGGIP